MIPGWETKIPTSPDSTVKNKKSHTLRVHLKYDFIKQKQGIEFTGTAEIPLDLSNTPIFFKEKEKASTHQHICVKKYNSHIHKNSLGYI